MFNIFKRSPKAVARVKYVDWTRVKTVEDLALILSRLNVSIAVREESWLELNHLLKDELKG